MYGAKCRADIIMVTSTCSSKVCAGDNQTFMLIQTPCHGVRSGLINRPVSSTVLLNVPFKPDVLVL